MAVFSEGCVKIICTAYFLHSKIKLLDIFRFYAKQQYLTPKILEIAIKNLQISTIVA